MQVNTIFHKHLRSALNHFYDHDYLRACELAIDLGVANRFDVPAALRKILADAIEVLKPTPGEPIGSAPHQIYDVLLYRYVQHFEQDEVAHHLGVSERQLRRVQAEALDALACHLWEKFRLEGKPMLEAQPGEDQPLPTGDAGDWGWLKGPQTERVSELRTALSNILDLTRPMAKQHRVELALQADENIPDLAMHPVALRQILLNLLGVAIHRVPEGQTTLRVHAQRPFVVMHIDVTPASAPQPPAPYPEARSLLDIAAHLAALSGGKLDWNDDEAAFHASLSAPIIDGIPVLAIDDNEDIIHLLERYATGTRYAVIGTTHPEQAVELAIGHGVQIIILDVMMPKIDGWEMLGRLQQHPQTAHLPVITLSILAQEDLALSLGAKAHLLKPVTQEYFLAALDRISALLAPVFR